LKPVVDWLNRTHEGDCRILMRRMIADGVKVDCVVTSPPYWGLRDYGVAGAFGLERTWVRHVARMRHVFRLVRELLTDDGVLWLNYGDSYYTPRPNGSVEYNFTINGKRNQEEFRRASRMKKTMPTSGGPNRRRQILFKPKDMVGMPWRIAFALQEDGWYLRSDIIWHKPNPMPESVLDRPTKAHEYVFLLAKSEIYHYDAQAIKERSSPDSHARARRAHSGYAPPGQKPHEGWAAQGVNPKAIKRVAGWQDGPGSHKPLEHAMAKGKHGRKFPQVKQNESFSAAVTELVDERNARTVWRVPTQPFEGAHFATFPEELVARCILAGSRKGAVIFDPFMGAGTVAKVATDLGRSFIGCELNPDYVNLGRERRTTTGMPI
jgi:site-specific DNA-methyltransferase (cytosine-N4-specific)